MLDNHIRGIPATKLILIKDSLTERGHNLVKFIINNESRLDTNVVHVVQFALDKDSVLPNHPKPNVCLHDFKTNIRGWLTNSSEINIDDIICTIAQRNGILVVDSLAGMIFTYGLQPTYRMIHKWKMNKGIKQIVLLLHTDIVENLDIVLNYFDQLATLSMQLEPKFKSDMKRVSYTLRKQSGKIIKEIEHYHFINEELVSEEIKKLDIKSLIQDRIKEPELPENLSTFKISLNDDEKEDRDKLVLPYLPKDNITIHYQLDAEDDWDEEDPDDDLDI